MAWGAAIFSTHNDLVGSASPREGGIELPLGELTEAF